jgi:hypothetical protein
MDKTDRRQEKGMSPKPCHTYLLYQKHIVKRVKVQLHRNVSGSSRLIIKAGKRAQWKKIVRNKESKKIFKEAKDKLIKKTQPIAQMSANKHSK